MDIKRNLCFSNKFDSSFNRFMTMAASLQEGCLNHQDIAEVAHALPPQSQYFTFARGYLHLEKEHVDSLVALHKEDRSKLNQSFIKAWAEKNPGQDQKKVSISRYFN